jgi:hypothetical protein
MATRAVLQTFERYQKERVAFVTAVAEMAKNPQVRAKSWGRAWDCAEAENLFRRTSRRCSKREPWRCCVHSCWTTCRGVGAGGARSAAAGASPGSRAKHAADDGPVPALHHGLCCPSTPASTAYNNRQPWR